MNQDLVISSTANPRLKNLISLRRKRARDAQGLTLVEGHDELELALRSGVRPRAVYYCPELLPAAERESGLLERCRRSGAELVRLTRPAFEKVAYREGADGVLAEAASVAWELNQIPREADSLFLIAQSVEKPGNLGAMLRTADACGAAAMIAADPVTDWANPNVVRASKGTVFAVPVASASTQDTVGWARAHGIRLIATTPAASTLYTDADLTGPVAIMVGTERDGLTDELLAEADERVLIPMAGVVNSLNVATSAAIVLYEALRQRGITQS